MEVLKNHKITAYVAKDKEEGEKDNNPWLAKMLPYVTVYKPEPIPNDDMTFSSTAF